mmetsp:Transcript_43233/g.104701  ORF Transcript_43233/g.104701 Transcript_43233/m.104701 type:complete len:514 (-) Transcript_43233:2590-4131(-)
MIKVFYAVAALLFAAVAVSFEGTPSVEAFVGVGGSFRSQQLPPTKTRQYMVQNNNGQYDISKPVFDILSFQQVRGDAVVRYSTLNQSEPLRISLFAILTAVLASAPSLSEALGYDTMSTPATAASLLSAVGSAGLFIRECKKRSNQLRRIVLELDTELLPIRLPTNILADKQFTQPVTLKGCRQQLSQPPRIIAVCGNLQKVNEALTSLSVFGKQRLKQANVYVVAVVCDERSGRCISPTDPEWSKFVASSEDTDNDNNNIFKPGRTSWLADPGQPQVWFDYFTRLSTSSSDDGESTSDIPSFRWFGINASGRSFGSGDGDIPRWLQVLGQYLRPTELLDASDPSSTSSTSATTTNDEIEVLQNATTTFYRSLTTGDQDGIEKIFSSSKSEAVTEVIGGGGRIDTWKDCLADGARPSGMEVSGADVTVISPTEAYTTIVEFPANAMMDGSSATLLAVQRWTRASDSEPWKLQLHETIPWTPETKAQGTLRCDCRGCLALTRTQERRTFGGVIG